METPGSHFPASCSFLGVADPKIRYYIDPETDEPHFFNHQVDCNEVDEVLATSTEDRPSRDGTRMALGQTANGRHLKVIYVRDSRDSSLFVITAYQLTGKALAAYRRRRRQRSQQ